MKKVSFNNEISEEYRDKFEALCEVLGPPKYKIIEAMIDTFALLPVTIQMIMKSNSPDARQLCIDLIRELELQPKQSLPSVKARNLKSL